MPTAAYPHIELSADGHLRIAGMDHLAHHWDAEELRRQHPHLTLAQIHSALAHYYDHQDEMDALIQQRLRDEEALIEQLGPSALQLKLRTLKKAQ